MIEQRLYERLRDDPDIAAIVAGRIEPMLAGQGQAMPYLVYMRPSGNPFNVSDGASDTTQARFQVDAIAATYAEVKALAKEVRDALTGWRDITLDPPVFMSHLTNELDDVENPSDSTADGPYRVIQDWLIEYGP